MSFETWLLLGSIGVVIAWGLFLRWRVRRPWQRSEVEDALKYLLEWELDGRPATAEALAGVMPLPRSRVFQLVTELERRGLIQREGVVLRLTPEGARWAKEVLRAHRLWERYLADEARVPLDKVHAEAHRWEHTTTPEALERLNAHLGYPAYDPHGDPIPGRTGSPVARRGVPLPDWPPGEEGVVTHLEDDPPWAYKRLVADGLHVGQHLRLDEVSGGEARFSDGKREYRLPTTYATNIFLAPPAEAGEQPPPNAVPLHEWPDGKPAEVVMLAPWLQGFTRRRLMDLGITPGAKITPTLRPFFGEPRAYRLRGTTIALRSDQASAIWVRPLPQTSAG